MPGRSPADAGPCGPHRRASRGHAGARGPATQRQTRRVRSANAVQVLVRVTERSRTGPGDARLTAPHTGAGPGPAAAGPAAGRVSVRGLPRRAPPAGWPPTANAPPHAAPVTPAVCPSQETPHASRTNGRWRKPRPRPDGRDPRSGLQPPLIPLSPSVYREPPFSRSPCDFWYFIMEMAHVKLSLIDYLLA